MRQLTISLDPIPESPGMRSATEQAHEQAAAGAAWLDRHEPGWAHRIDLTELDMAQADRCVGAQAHRPRGGVVDPFDYARFSEDHRLSPARQLSLGFLSSDPVGYHHLQQAWETIILERRRSSSPEVAAEISLFPARRRDMFGWLPWRS